MERKKKRTIRRHWLSLLLVFALIVTVLPTTVPAATMVKKVAVTMSTPKEGASLPTSAKVSNSSVKVTAVKWKGSTNSGKAKGNVKYKVTITLQIKSGKAAKFGTGKISATVNGKKASVKRNSAKKITVTYTFPTLGKTILNLGTGHTKEEINAKWTALKPVNSDKNLFIEEPKVVSAPFKTGTVKSEVLTDGVNMLNFSRYVAGLNSDVSLDSTLNEKTQYGAVLMAHINKMEHKPAKPSDMDQSFYAKGYEATSSSNLARYITANADATGDTKEFLSWSVRSWLSDSGVSSLGHRIWCLDPVMKGTGFGVAIGKTYTYSDMWVHNTNKYGTGSGTSNWDAIPWPAAGYHPTNLITKDDEWSVRFNGKRFSVKSSDVRVKVTNAAGRTQECKTRINTDFGDPVLIFQPTGTVGNGDKYDVEISGITKGGSPVVIKYSVEFFKLGSTSTNKPSDTSTDLDLSGEITYKKLSDFISKSGKGITVTNDTTEESLLKALTSYLPANSGYAFTILHFSKTNATVKKDGSIFATVAFIDLAKNYTSPGQSVVYKIPATGASDAGEAKKIDEDVKAIRQAFKARIASAKSKDDLKKKDLLEVAKNAVKNGSSVEWLNDPLFSTMSAKDGKNGWVKGVLSVKLGAEIREIEFYAVLHPDGSITDGSK